MADRTSIQVSTNPVVISPSKKPMKRDRLGFIPLATTVVRSDTTTYCVSHWNYSTLVLAERPLAIFEAAAQTQNQNTATFKNEK